MTATFPGGVKQFPVINPGDPILSSTENAQQEEIVAIETEYRRMGLQNLADPNADRVLFWDDSAGALKWLTVDGIVGTDLGKWQAYTPVWTASTTNPSIGNGTLVGKYINIGKLVTANIMLTAGSTTTFGNGTWAFSLPITVAGSNIQYLGSWAAQDTGTSWYAGTVFTWSGATKLERFIRDGLLVNYLSIGQPHAWASGDVLYISIAYEGE